MGLPYRAAEYTEVSLSSIRATANITHYLCLETINHISYYLQNYKYESEDLDIYHFVA